MEIGKQKAWDECRFAGIYYPDKNALYGA